MRWNRWPYVSGLVESSADAGARGKCERGQIAEHAGRVPSTADCRAASPDFVHPLRQLNMGCPKAQQDHKDPVEGRQPGPDRLAMRTGRSRLADRMVDERRPPGEPSVDRPVRGKHIGQVRLFEFSISLVVRSRAPQDVIQHEEGHFYGTGAKVTLAPDSNRFVEGAELIVEDLRRDEAVRVDDRFDHFLQIGCQLVAPLRKRGRPQGHVVQLDGHRDGRLEGRHRDAHALEQVRFVAEPSVAPLRVGRRGVPDRHMQERLARRQVGHARQVEQHRLEPGYHVRGLMSVPFERPQEEPNVPHRGGGFDEAPAGGHAAQREELAQQADDAGHVLVTVQARQLQNERARLQRIAGRHGSVRGREYTCPVLGALHYRLSGDAAVGPGRNSPASPSRSDRR